MTMSVYSKLSLLDLACNILKSFVKSFNTVSSKKWILASNSMKHIIFSKAWACVRTHRHLLLDCDMVRDYHLLEILYEAESGAHIQNS